MRSILVLAALSFAALASGASAQPGVITNPDWQSRPTGEQLASAYPGLALILNLEGRATVGCKVNDLGLLVDCEVRSELPEGLGFGQAALALTERFRMKPRTINGEPVDGGSVRIPIRFTLPGDKLGLPPLAPKSSETRVALAREIWSRGGGDAAFIAAMEERLIIADDYDLAPEALVVARQALREAAEATAREAGEFSIASLAARYDEPELRALAHFAVRPAGRVWLGLDPARAISWAEILSTWFEMVATDARGRVCASRLCIVDGLEVASPPQGARIVDPEWLQEPTFDHLMQSLPEPLKMLRVGGAVRLLCRVDTVGVPENCSVTGETPPKLGLAAAALELAPWFKLNAQMMGQGAAGETLSFVVVFPGANFPGLEATVPAPGAPVETRALALEVARLQMNEGPTETSAPKLSADPSLEAEADAALAAAAVAQRPAFAQLLADELGRTLTRTELEDLRAFLSSPAGRQVATRDGDAGRAMIDAMYYRARVGVMAGEAYCRNRACLPAAAAVSPAPEPAVRP